MLYKTHFNMIHCEEEHETEMKHENPNNKKQKRNETKEEMNDVILMQNPPN